MRTSITPAEIATLKKNYIDNTGIDVYTTHCFIRLEDIESFLAEIATLRSAGKNIEGIELSLVRFTGNESNTKIKGHIAKWLGDGSMLKIDKTGLTQVGFVIVPVDEDRQHVQDNTGNLPTLGPGGEHSGLCPPCQFATKI